MIKRPRYQHAAVRRNSDEVGPLGKACASPVDDDLWYTRAAAARASLPRCRDMPRSFALRIARRRPIAHDEAGLHDGVDRCALVLRAPTGYRSRGGTLPVKAEGERNDIGRGEGEKS